jgi:membrane fusion protein (multidrug efflux system)
MGYVARRSVQVGQRVSQGTPLMAIVPLDGVRVDADFKEEVQLRHMRIGQPVTLSWFRIVQPLTGANTCCDRGIE